MKLIMLSNVYTMSVSLEKTLQNGQQNDQRNAAVKKSESLTKSSDITLLELVQKEPKFFDEFECKYIYMCVCGKDAHCYCIMWSSSSSVG